MKVYVNPQDYWALLGMQWQSEEWYRLLDRATGIGLDVLKSEAITLSVEQNKGDELTKVASAHRL